MNKEFVPYEQALALKELGFNEPCLAYCQKSAIIGNETILPPIFSVNTNDEGWVKLDKLQGVDWNNYSKQVPYYSLPLYQQAFRWFREKYELNFYIWKKLLANYF